MHEDVERCRQAVRTRNRAFDGRFVAVVVTTGVYCRPSCPGLARAKDENVRFVPDVDAAQRGGFRACKRCDPNGATTADAEAASHPAAPDGSCGATMG